VLRGEPSNDKSCINVYREELLATSAEARKGPHHTPSIRDTTIPGGKFWPASDIKVRGLESIGFEIDRNGAGGQREAKPRRKYDAFGFRNIPRSDEESALPRKTPSYDSQSSLVLREQRVLRLDLPWVGPEFELLPVLLGVVPEVSFVCSSSIILLY